MNRRTFLGSLGGLASAAVIIAKSQPSHPNPEVYSVGDLVKIRELNGWDYHWNNPDKPVRSGLAKIGGRLGVIAQVSMPCESNKAWGPSYSIHPIGAWFRNDDIDMVTPSSYGSPQ